MIDYKLYLKNELYDIFSDLGIEENYSVVVENERIFLEQKEEDNFYLDPHTIYVVIKYLRGQYYVDSTEIPIVIYALGENDSLDIVKMVFNIFGQKNNLKTTNINYYDNNGIEKIVPIKQTFTTPTISDNFLQMGYGYRTMVTMSGNISIFLESNDIEKLEYVMFDENDNPILHSIELYSGTLTYVMQPDGQPSMNKKFVSSEFKTAHCTMNLQLPFYNELSEEEIVCNEFYFKILKSLSIEKENDDNYYEDEQETKLLYLDYNGLNKASSEPYYFKITLKSGFVLRYKMVLFNCSITTNKGGLPIFSLNFGL